MARNDLCHRMRTGYEAQGPQKLEKAAKGSIRYSNIVHRKTPAGSYTLEFKKFNLELSALKA